jgi:hypothetical protein
MAYIIDLLSAFSTDSINCIGLFMNLTTYGYIQVFEKDSSQIRTSINLIKNVKFSIQPLSACVCFSTLKEILGALDDKLTSADLDGIIAEIDTDGSGTVDFDGKLHTAYYKSFICIQNFLFLTEFMEMMAGD